MRSGRPGVHPTAAQILLLGVVLGDEVAAQHAWEEWSADVDLDTLDQESAGLLPQLYLRLRTLGIEHPLMVRLKGIHRSHWYRNQLLLSQIGSLQGRLDAAGITALLVQGAVLAARNPVDAGVRPLHDAALLVAPGLARGAAHVLVAAGWRPARRSPEKLTPAYLETETFECFRTDTGLELELCWRLLRRGDGGNPHALIAGEPLSVEGLTLATLCPTDELLRVCVDSSLGRLPPRVLWIADAAALLRGSTVDWARFEHLASRFDVTAETAAALALLSAALAQSIPRDVIDRLAARPESRRHRIASLIEERGGEIPLALLRMMEHVERYLRLRRVEARYGGAGGFIVYLQEVHGLAGAGDVARHYLRGAASKILGSRWRRDGDFPIDEVSRKI